MILFIICILVPLLALAIWLFLSLRQRQKLSVSLPVRRLRLVEATLIILLFISMVLPISPPKEQGATQNRNLDVYIVMDTSLSMKASDYTNQKTRLDGIKSDFAPKLTSLSGSRFTLVSFQGRPYVEIPAIYDVKSVQDTIKTLEPPLLYDATGTSFVPALKLAEERINRSIKQEKTANMKRVLIIISDGERIAEDADAKDQLAKLKKIVDKSLVIGVGTAEGATMKVATSHSGGPNYDQIEEAYVYDPAASYDKPGPRDDKGILLAVSKADIPRLKGFASSLGGSYIQLNPSANIKSELDKLAAGSSFSGDGKQSYTRSAPNSYYWAAALLCLIAVWFMQLRIKWVAKR